jgi:hypothetical protein
MKKLERKEKYLLFHMQEMEMKKAQNGGSRLE